jgi:hypothetical protein
MKIDSHLPQNSLTSTIPWLTPTRALSPSQTLQLPPCGRYTLQPISVLGPATTLSPSFLLAQAIFEPNRFTYFQT